MNSRSDDALWTRSVDVAFVDDGARVVLLSLETPQASRPLLLSGSAAAIWRSLDNEPRSSETIAALAQAGFAPTHTNTSQDVEVFLEALHIRRLIRHQAISSSVNDETEIDVI